MRSMMKLGILVVVLAFGVIGAANASAAAFTASATGELEGEALENSVFTFNSGTVECTGADTTGTIASVETTEQDVETEYTGCKAFGLVTIHISKAKYKFTADETVHLKAPITITITKTLFTGHCTITIPAQTVGIVHYVNINGMTDSYPTITNTHYTSSGGGPCGTPGTYTNGGFTDPQTIKRVGGGSRSYDP